MSRSPLPPPPTKFGPGVTMQSKTSSFCRYETANPPLTKFGPGGATQQKPTTADVRRNVLPPPTRYTAGGAAQSKSATQSIVMRPCFESSASIVTAQPRNPCAPSRTVQMMDDAKPLRPEDFKILYRGTHNLEEINKIKMNKSFGGAVPDPNCGKPPEDVVINQVGRGIKEGIQEYTSERSVAEQFAGENGWVIAIIIEKNYLVTGSGSEFGWAAYSEAPIIDCKIIKEGKKGSENKKFFNAA